MAKSDFKPNSSDITSINGVNIREGCPPSNMNDAIRHVMADLSETINKVDATPSVSGYMSAGDKTKLDGIATNANNYVHPTSGVIANTYGQLENTTLPFGGLFTIPKIVVNNLGHITSASSISITLPAAPTTISGNAGTATKLATARTISLTGDVTGSVSFDGSSNVSITTVVADDSHNHTIANIDNLQTTLNAKAPLQSPTLTGIPTAPTASSGTNTTQIATTAFVTSAVNAVLGANDAMLFKGTLGTGGVVTALPTTNYQTGWTYKVITAGTYAGVVCEIGDLIICVSDYATSFKNTDWTVVQTNIDGAVTGPASSVNNRVAVFNGTTGKLIKDSGFTIAKSVPSDAVFTDTTYSVATTSANGLMSSADKTKLDKVTTTALVGNKIDSLPNTRTATLAKNTNFTVPSYKVGSNTLMVFLDGVYCVSGTDAAQHTYKEIGTANAMSTTIQFHDDITVDHSITAIVFGLNI